MTESLSIHPANARLTMLVGIPGTGKTTWARSALAAGRVISSDAIRDELGVEYSPESNEEVFALYWSRIEKLLGDGWSVIADATNLRAEDWQKHHEVAVRNGARAVMVIFANLTEALDRNREREEGQVPEVAMTKMILRFADLMKHLPAGVFDEVTILNRPPPIP